VAINESPDGWDDDIRRHRKRHKGHVMRRMRGAVTDGFTLVELLIVIIVLGVLVSIVLLAVGSAKSTASTTACKADSRAVRESAESVLGHGGDYPDGTYTDDAAVGGLPTNPLVAGAVAPPGPIHGHGHGHAHHPQDPYDNGAVLAHYPASAAYEIVYTGAADGGSYALSVNKPAGSGWQSVGGCDDL
jgi:prepilin-type N-terminal cleavage/methylation domain-containing protein